MQAPDLLVSGLDIQTMYSDGFGIFDAPSNFPINGYAVFRDILQPQKSCAARYAGQDKWILLNTNSKIGGIAPKDLHQLAFSECLLDEEVLVNVGCGPAGTGKTTLALAYALEAYKLSKKRILLVKPTVMVGSGKAFGPVPGDIQDKYAPYLSSFEIVLKKTLGTKAKSFLQIMKEKEELQFIPLELARGCTFENCTLILDEAQNTSWHEMNTLMSRLGENSKFIVLGDLNQIDIKLPAHSTGLGTLISSHPFLDSKETSLAFLDKQYRSPICKLASEIDQWVRGT